MSQRRGTIVYRVTHAGSYLRTQRAFSEPTLILAAKDVLCPYVGGTVTHRSRSMDSVARGNVYVNVRMSVWVKKVRGLELPNT